MRDENGSLLGAFTVAVSVTVSVTKSREYGVTVHETCDAKLVCLR